MSRAKTYHVSCLNLTVHPHDKPDTYIRLIKALGQIKYAKVYGDTCGTIRYLQETTTGNGGNAYMTGMFVRFTHLDPNSGWFNTEDKSNVDTETDGRPILPINLKPNRTETNFIFFPTSDCHKLFFISDKFSPVLAQKFLKRLADNKDIANEFGDINIEIMTTSDAIQQVLQLNSISSLLIKVNMPNADDLDDCEQEQIDRLSKQGVGKMTQQMNPLKGHQLAPDQQTIALMKVATIHGNGFIQAKGEDPSTGVKRTVSSKDYPDTRDLVIEAYDKTPFHIRFLDFVKEWLNQLR